MKISLKHCPISGKGGKTGPVSAVPAVSAVQGSECWDMMFLSRAMLGHCATGAAAVSNFLLMSIGFAVSLLPHDGPILQRCFSAPGIKCPSAFVSILLPDPLGV